MRWSHRRSNFVNLANFAGRCLNFYDSNEVWKTHETPAAIPIKKLLSDAEEACCPVGWPRGYTMPSSNGNDGL